MESKASPAQPTPEAKPPRTAMEFLDARLEETRAEMRQAAHDLARCARVAVSFKAWMRYRPWLAGGLLAGTAALTSLGIVRHVLKKRKGPRRRRPPRPQHAAPRKEAGLLKKMLSDLVRALWQGFMGIFVTLLSGASVNPSESRDGIRSSKLWKR